MARDARILRLAAHHAFIRRNTDCALRGLTSWRTHIESTALRVSKTTTSLLSSRPRFIASTHPSPGRMLSGAIQIPSPAFVRSAASRWASAASDLVWLTKTWILLFTLLVDESDRTNSPARQPPLGIFRDSARACADSPNARRELQPTNSVRREPQARGARLRLSARRRCWAPNYGRIFFPGLGPLPGFFSRGGNFGLGFDMALLPSLPLAMQTPRGAEGRRTDRQPAVSSLFRVGQRSRQGEEGYPAQNEST